MYRGAVRGRPKLFVLAGVWIIFLPVFLGDLIVFYNGLLNLNFSGYAFATLWWSFFSGVISGTMLFKVTRNYLTIPKLSLGESNQGTTIR